MTYPLPPATRQVGQANPPQDVDQLTAALAYALSSTPGGTVTAPAIAGTITGRGATITVAASNSSASRKQNADFVCTGLPGGGTDEVTINNAIGAVPGVGGRVILLEGTYVRTGSVVIDQSFVILEGQGSAGTNISANPAGVTGPAVIVGNTKTLSASGVKGLQITDTNGAGVPVSGSSHGIVYAVNAGIMEDVVVQPVAGDEFHVSQDLVNFALNTTVAAGSIGVSLPTGTLNVTSTTGFTSAGNLYVPCSTGVAFCSYTSTSGGNQFTGCTWSFPGNTATISAGTITQPGHLFDLTAINCYAQKQNAVTGNGWYIDETYSSCELYACRAEGANSKPGSTGTMNGFKILGSQIKLYGCHAYFWNGYGLAVNDKNIFSGGAVTVYGGEWENNATGGTQIWNPSVPCYLNGQQFYGNGIGTGQTDINLPFGTSAINILGATFRKTASGNLAQNIYMQHASYVYIDHCEFDYPVIARAILVDGSAGSGNACSYVFIRDNRCIGGSSSTKFVVLNGATTNCTVSGNVTDASIVEATATGTPNSNMIHDNTLVPGNAATITLVGANSREWNNAGYDSLPGGGVLACAPVAFGPATPGTFATTSSTFTAVDTGVVCTNAFTAPGSGSVVVTCALGPYQASTTGNFAAFALCQTGSAPAVTGQVIQTKIAATGVNAPTTLQWLVTGLTPGTSYQFDLMYAVGGGSTLTLYYGSDATLGAGNIGGQIIMTVQSV